MTNLDSRELARLGIALAAVCQQAGIDPAGAELLRYTMNAVYRIDACGVVIRMTRSANDAVVTKVAKVGAAFAALDLPTTRLAPGIVQPIHVAGWSATAWVLLPQTPGHRHEPVDLAAPLRALHAVSALDFPLPRWNPVDRARARLSRAADLRGHAADFLQRWSQQQLDRSLSSVLDELQRRCDDLTAAAAAADWTLPWSLIHGDAHAGNLLTTPDGQVVLGDLDAVSIGPPEWDLVPAAHGALRFGDDPAHHRALARAYGLDVTTTPAWETLRQIRELQLVTSVIAELPGRPDVATVLAHRLTTTLADDHTTMWSRYK